MTEQPTPPQSDGPSTRHVIEHALTNYGYSEATVRALVDQLIEEETR